MSAESMEFAALLLRDAAAGAELAEEAALYDEAAEQCEMRVNGACLGKAIADTQAVRTKSV